MARKPIMAILYDFDKTLSTTDMQNYSFIPALGMTPAEFWGATNDFTMKYGVERILSYMYMMIRLCKEKNIRLTKKWLNSLGKDIIYFPGVLKWFDRIDEYGRKKGVRIEHYVLSSGTKEIIEGASIARHFKAIFGSEFVFDPRTEEPIWPKLAVNYTQKTQYFFRISKGTIDLRDDKKINEKATSRRIPYQNIVYIGDGMTDVPCMVVVRQNGGKAIAIYDKKDQRAMITLLKQGRVNYACTADYTEGSNLDKTMKLIVDSVAVNHALARKEELQLKAIKESD